MAVSSVRTASSSLPVVAYKILLLSGSAQMVHTTLVEASVMPEVS